MGLDVKQQVGSILVGYDPAAPQPTADALRALWLQFEPKSIEVIKAELREEQETVGIPVEVLRDIGKEVGKVWTDFREGSDSISAGELRDLTPKMGPVRGNRKCHSQPSNRINRCLSAFTDSLAFIH